MEFFLAEICLKSKEEGLLGRDDEVRHPLPETEPLWHMAQSKEHRHLRSATLKRFFTAFGATEIILFYNFIPDKSVTIWPNRDSEQFCCLRVDEVGRSIMTAAKEIVVKQEREKMEDKNNVVGKVEQLQVQVASLERLVRQRVKKIDK